MTKQKFISPAVSVVIPLYNAEKYIAECLDSLLAQTFTDFEVIVVDDGSTDASPAIVESYAEKFGGRLQCFKTKKNTGSGTEPRNLGIVYSRGEYLYLMDNDDAVTPTALEELYTAAKKFDADVVHCEKYYEVPARLWNDAESRKKLKPFSYVTGEKVFLTEPLIWADNLEERIKFFSQRKLTWNYWVKLVRRDFIVENSIKAVGVMADDMIFTICALCCAKKYVLVPNVIYFYRKREDSLIHKDSDTLRQVNSWLKMIRDGVEHLDEFFSENDFLSSRPDLKHLLTETFANEMLGHLTQVYAKIPAHELDELLRETLGDGDNAALTALLFSEMNVRHLQLLRTQRRIAVLENEMKSDRRQLMTAQQRLAALEAELKNR